MHWKCERTHSLGAAKIQNNESHTELSYLCKNNTTLSKRVMVRIWSLRIINLKISPVKKRHFCATKKSYKIWIKFKFFKPWNDAILYFVIKIWWTALCLFKTWNIPPIYKMQMKFLCFLLNLTSWAILTVKIFKLNFAC